MEPAYGVREFEQFARHDLLQAVDLGDPVTDLDDRSDLVDGHARVEIFDLGTYDLVDLVGFDCFHVFVFGPSILNFCVGPSLSDGRQTKSERRKT